MTTEPRVSDTAIPGMYVVDLVVHADDRGSFTETYTRARLEGLGLPHLDFVQSNVAVNKPRGVLRGIHAEPWDKYATVVHGAAFAAIVDLRAGSGFGRVETVELGPGRAILIPGGCGNAYETLAPDTVYSYLVTDYWSADAAYKAVDPFDPDLAIAWPVPRDAAVLSEKDRANPRLRDTTPYA